MRCYSFLNVSPPHVLSFDQGLAQLYSAQLKWLLLTVLKSMSFASYSLNVLNMLINLIQLNIINRIIENRYNTVEIVQKV